MTAARRLMLKHNLEDAGERSSYSVAHLGQVRARTPLHEKLLSGILTEHFFVEGLWVPAVERHTWRSGWVLEVMGRPWNVAMAEYVHAFVLQTADRLLAQHQAQTGERGQRVAGRFLAGVMTGFDESLRRAERGLRQEGLVWVGDAQLGEFLHARHPRVRRSSGAQVQADAHFGEGRRAGREIVVHKPVAGAAVGRGRLLTGG